MKQSSLLKLPQGILIIVYLCCISCDWGHLFPSISDHRFHIDAGFEDDYITQIVKRISQKYLTMRLHTYGKR